VEGGGDGMILCPIPGISYEEVHKSARNISQNKNSWSNGKIIARFDVLTAVLMEIQVPLDVTLCGW
jgi:hypothetical protein